MASPLAFVPSTSKLPSFNDVPGLSDILASLHKQREEADAQSEAAWQALQGAIAAPEPQIDPMAELLTRLGGQISSVLDPKMGGAASAEGAITAEKESLKTKQLRSLQAQQLNYSRLAERAEKAGDLEAGAKLRASELKAMKEAEELERKQRNEAAVALQEDAQAHDTEQRRLERDNSNTIAKLNRDLQITLNDDRLESKRLIAMIQKGFDPDTGLPLPMAEVKRPTANEWNSTIQDAYRLAKGKDGKLDKDLLASQILGLIPPQNIQTPEEFMNYLQTGLVVNKAGIIGIFGKESKPVLDLTDPEIGKRAQAAAYRWYGRYPIPKGAASSDSTKAGTRK